MAVLLVVSDRSLTTTTNGIGRIRQIVRKDFRGRRTAVLAVEIEHHVVGQLDDNVARSRT
jgi:hypothetical protein